MKLHELKPDPGSRKKARRVGRGISAGQGKTAGRGTKGQKSRTGGAKGPYFEGGQLPLVRRLPFKRGFNNIFRIEYQEVSLKKLAEAFTKATKITSAELFAAGLIKDADKPVVILGGDVDLKAKLTVSAHRITQSAREKIEAAGGSFTQVPLVVTGARATVKLLKKEQIAALKDKQ
jgi:large subunit ribosomal protein L15